MKTHLSILYVGKESFYLPTIKDFCKKLYCTSTNAKALKIFINKKPDIVIYAKDDDLKFCRDIKEQAPTTPILYIGQKDAQKLYEALEARVDKYLLLPVDERLLQDTLEEFISKLFMQKAREYNVFMLHQYKNAIDSSNIVSKTDVNGIITYVNEEFCKISGYSKEELIGKNHNIVRHPDVPKEHFKKFWDTILAKKIWKGTVKNRAKDGSTFYVNTTVIPILDWHGEIVEFVAIRYDVTESVKLQEKLQKKEKELELLNKGLEKRVEEKTKQLRQLNLTLEKRVKNEVAKNREKDRLMFQQARLASLGEMLGNIAHQWRQPLMELSILFYKMKKLSSNAQEIDKLYERGSTILEKMSQTISDFQNFFSPTKEKEHFNVIENIQNTYAIIEGTLKKNHIALKLYHTTEPLIYGYKNEFSQVILNILNNAKDVLIERNIPQKEITIQIRECQDFVRVEIEDNAGGVDKSIVDKIFEPYFTTKPAKKGTGLGLYMSKMIVEQSMGGELKLKNTKKGAKFIIKLPRG